MRSSRPRSPGRWREDREAYGADKVWLELNR
jgi:hypothetical protein